MKRLTVPKRRTCSAGYRADLEDLQQALRLEALAGVLPLIEEFVGTHEDERRAGGEADYDDLLIWARNLLRDKPEVQDVLPGSLPTAYSSTSSRTPTHCRPRSCCT